MVTLQRTKINPEMDYFKDLLALLNIERREDRQFYQDIINNSSVQQRRENGLSWYPVAIRDSELSRGDYLTVELERPSHTDIQHQFRFGASAALFSNQSPVENRTEGTIAYIGGNRMKLTLRTDELPEWARDGKLGVDLLFDENSYEEMQQALRSASNEKNHPLVTVLTGQRPPAFGKYAPPSENAILNSSQNAAVSKILAAEELAIVHGPPGTGKTTTLIQAIRAMLARDGKQLLVTAPSNTAVDLLTERLAGQGVRVMRLGNPVRVSENLQALTLEAKTANHPMAKEIRRLKKQANEFRNLAHKYKRHFGKAEREQRKALFDEAHRIMKDVEKTEQYIVDDLLGNAEVLTATLVGINHYQTRHLRFDTAVIDEAGQSIEPACWIPILKARRLILAGDHQQLPPTIKSQEAAAAGLAITLLEKMVALYPTSVVLLEEQYRMNGAIMQYPSSVFYDGRLKAHPSVAAQKLFDDDAPLQFIDTAGCGFEEKQQGTSVINEEEASFLIKHLRQFATTLLAFYDKDKFPDTAIISPYKQQVLVLEELLGSDELLRSLAGRISVSTVDSFQGQERDMVYIGLTRSNSDSRIGFLAEIRRMNVAMTRARKKLVMVGDSSTLSSFPFYDNFIRYAQESGAWTSAWEFLI